MRTPASNKAICIILLILIHLVIIVCDYYNNLCYLIILSTSIDSKVIESCLDMITMLGAIIINLVYLLFFYFILFYFLFYNTIFIIPISCNYSYFSCYYTNKVM